MSWPLVPLNELCAARVETTDPKKLGEHDFLYVDISSIDSTRKAICTARRVLSSDAPSRARKVLRRHDIIVSMTRPNLNAVALVDEEHADAIGSTGFCVLRPNGRLLPQYLFHFVKTPEFVGALSALTSGALYPAVTEAQVREQPIPLPPLDEQRRIIDILDRASGIQRLRKAADDKMRELIPALFVDMFGDPASNPKRWALGKIDDVLISAEYGSSAKASELPIGVPMLRMGNVSMQGELLLDDLKYVSMDDEVREKYVLDAGDILFNRTNSKELVGKTGIWDGRMEAVYASYFIRLRVRADVMLPEVLWAFLNTRTVKRTLFGMAKGAIGQANINAKELRNMELFMPPLALQERFRSILKELNDQAAAHAVANSYSVRLFGSLSSELLG